MSSTWDFVRNSHFYCTHPVKPLMLATPPKLLMLFMLLRALSAFMPALFMFMPVLIFMPPILLRPPIPLMLLIFMAFIFMFMLLIDPMLLMLLNAFIPAIPCALLPKLLNSSSSLKSVIVVSGNVCVA